MKLLVLGATGGTGRQVVSQALAAGHTVTAYVRKAMSAVEGVRIASGDAASATALERAVAGQDAVVCALGRGTSLSSENLMSRSMRALAPIMARCEVARLILVSAHGVGASRAQVPLVPRLFQWLLLRDIFADKLAAEDQLRATRLQWTIVQPVALTDGPHTGNYRVGERLELRGIPKIARADVAHFILAELRQPAYVRKSVVISY